MNDGVHLGGLSGRNPLGFLAALGVVDVLERAGRTPTIWWDHELVPSPIVTGADDVDEIATLCDADRLRWRTSPVLTWGPDGAPAADVKATREDLAAWSSVIAAADEADIGLWSALVASGGVDRNGATKPTHLHFTAGQQRFLVMVRDLFEKVDRERFVEALAGPWRYDSVLPSLSWDARGERIYALRGADPAKERRLGVPGADLLAFLGLRSYPTAVVAGRLVTTACDRDWKRSAFRWPLWGVPVGADVVRSLVAEPSLVGRDSGRRSERVLAAMGVRAVLEAPIRRSEQGGYGSFGAPDVLVENTSS